MIFRPGRLSVGEDDLLRGRRQGVPFAAGEAGVPEQGIELREGDIMEVAFQGFGRPLRNPLKMENGAGALVRVAAVS